MSTVVSAKWIRRTEVQMLLYRAGMPSSRGTIESLLLDPSSGFPEPRRTTDRAIRLWDRELVEAWIARSRCSDVPAGQAVNS